MKARILAAIAVGLATVFASVGIYVLTIRVLNVVSTVSGSRALGRWLFASSGEYNYAGLFSPAPTACVLLIVSLCRRYMSRSQELVVIALLLLSLAGTLSYWIPFLAFEFGHGD